MHKLFQLVPEIQKKEYNQYLDSSKEKKVQIGDHCWNYRIFDEYGSWIIILPGVRFTSSIYYQYALRLARRFKIMILEIPEGITLAEAITAFGTITEKEKISNFTIIGFNDFGFMAPLLAQKYNEECRNIVISNTLINTASMPRQLRDTILAGLEKSLKKLKYSTQGAVGKKLLKSWSAIPARIIGEELFWQTYFKAESSTCSKESEASYLSIVKDFLENYQIDVDKIRNIKCLFIDVSNESDQIQKDLSLAIRDFFPSIKIIDERRNNGNAAILARKTTLINLIEDFIKETT
jgi:hypothetical protein